MNPDLFWVPGPWRGKLAVVARPRGGDWLEDEASGWHRSGIDVVVSLLEEAEAADLDLAHERDVAESNGVHFVSFPIPDRGVPASTPDALALLKDLAGTLEEGRNVAVHCRQSIGRSGLIAAGVLLMSGIGVEKAIEVVSTARGQSIPETTAQLRWLRHLPSAKLAVA
jgi:protein-tyrosine phosphatase